MTEAELSLEIKNGTAQGIYFFYGDEDYTKNHRTAALAASVAGGDPSLAAFNVIKLRFDERAPDLSAISDAMLAPPVMSQSKAVVAQFAALDSLTEREKSATLAMLEDFSADDYGDTVLVISAAADGFDPGTQKKPSAFLSSVSKLAKVVRFDYGSDAKLERWMARHFAEYGLSYARGVTEAIISVCGKSMYRLTGELAKIAAYTAARGDSAVTVSHVSACATRTDEDDAFRLANCIVEGDTAGALSALAVKMRRREDPIFVLSQVNRAFCDLAVASAFIADGREREDYARAMKMHEYKAGLYMRSAKLRSPEFFRRAAELCVEADFAIKSSPIGYAAIERLICSCTE